MPLKATINYSPNFNIKKRPKKSIKFLIYHYTGMKSETAAIKKLTNIQSEVASHYLIKKNGEIVIFVPDSYVAWHAGVSAWKKYKFLNQNSIGIEISNPGHQFGYKKFSLKQINSVIKLSRFLIKKYKINKLTNKKCNKILNNKFFANLYKIGYSKNYKKQNEKLLIKAFQRRFRPSLINGIIDQECLLLSKNLI